MIGTPTIAPFIDVVFYVTSIFGETGTRTHRGLDIATSLKQNVYSIIDGTLILNQYSSSYGNYVIIKGNNGIGVLYAHLDSKPLIVIGTQIKKGDYIGLEGTTGESTGVHLHVEMQDISSHDWIYSAPIETYINPATYMGIDNVKGTAWLYKGETPTPTIIKHKFKWVLYAHKFRNDRFM